MILIIIQTDFFPRITHNSYLSELRIAYQLESLIPFSISSFPTTYGLSYLFLDKNKIALDIN